MTFASHLKYNYYVLCWNGIHIFITHFILIENGKPAQQVRTEISILNNDTHFESVLHVYSIRNTSSVATPFPTDGQVQKEHETCTNFKMPPCGRGLIIQRSLQINNALKVDDDADHAYLAAGTNGCWQQPENCTSGLTVCFWLKIKPRNKKGLDIIVKSAGACSKKSPDAGFCIAYEHIFPDAEVVGNYTQIEFGVKTGTETYYLNTTLAGESDWNHICATFGNDTGIKSYINGTLTAYDNIKIEKLLEPGKGKIQFGSSQPSLSGRFKIDEFGIWEHELSSEQVNCVYTQFC